MANRNGYANGARLVITPRVATLRCMSHYVTCSLCSTLSPAVLFSRRSACGFLSKSIRCLQLQYYLLSRSLRLRLCAWLLSYQIACAIIPTAPRRCKCDLEGNFQVPKPVYSTVSCKAHSRRVIEARSKRGLSAMKSQTSLRPH